MSDKTIYGPGMLFVRSRIAPESKDILNENVFLNWYDEEHIPEVVSKSGIRSCFRYHDIDKTSSAGDARNPKPYLACYPMHDLAFTQGDEFKAINVKSPSLPGSGIIYDLADMDVSYLGFLGATPSKTGSEDNSAKYIITFGIKPKTDPDRDEVMKFYKQQTSKLLQTPFYIRSLYFKLLYARTNAQSRALKGLPTTDEPHPDPPTWLAVHEFAELPKDTVTETLLTINSKGLSQDEESRDLGATESEVHTWGLCRAHGNGWFFDDWDVLPSFK